MGTRDREQVRQFAKTLRGKSYMEQNTENRTQDIVADTARAARLYMENLHEQKDNDSDSDNHESESTSTK